MTQCAVSVSEDQLSIFLQKAVRCGTACNTDRSQGERHELFPRRSKSRYNQYLESCPSVAHACKQGVFRDMNMEVLDYVAGISRI